MATKLDIMNRIEKVAPGEEQKWQLVGGKPTKVEKAVAEVKEELKVIGPVVKEGIEEVKIVKKEIVHKKTKKVLAKKETDKLWEK